MPEGTAAGGIVTGGAVHDDPDRPPEPSAEAPRGWTWNRADRAWKPKVRGQVLWSADGPGGAGGTDAGSEAGDSGPVTPPGGRDPAPAWHREDRALAPAEAGKIPFEKVPQQVKDDIAGLMGLVGTPILGILQHADPYCGGALAECFEPAVDATLPLICRSSKIVRYFAEDKSDWLTWGKVALAFSPLLRAVAEHHVFRSVEIVRDKNGDPVYNPAGELMVQDRAPAGNADPLQPAAQPPDLQAYVA